MLLQFGCHQIFPETLLAYLSFSLRTSHTDFLKHYNSLLSKRTQYHNVLFLIPKFLTYVKTFQKRETIMTVFSTALKLQI
jgi:hypothetical protein